MRTKFNRNLIPWVMAAGRAMLGPVLILGASCGWNGVALASMVVAALLSDIFDGVLARRWRCDTAGVRLFDSMADTVFYAGAAIAVWVGRPQVWQRNATLLVILLGMEGVRAGFEFAKFGKPASYHSYVAKAWGLILAAAVVAAFVWPGAQWLMPVALAMGILTNAEGLMISIMLPVWRHDVKTLKDARRLRRETMWVAAQGEFGPVVFVR
ncbi:MAG TPA: CDP-alcohol phosphatidyltransferase family protein [Acidobacteriaceae bacterium]|nr:CDP-alcohol phosphatidyltransferase family protein [Acidobacteriaceae bacterium]